MFSAANRGNEVENDGSGDPMEKSIYKLNIMTIQFDSKYKDCYQGEKNANWLKYFPYANPPPPPNDDEY